MNPVWTFWIENTGSITGTITLNLGPNPNGYLGEAYFSLKMVAIMRTSISFKFVLGTVIRFFAGLTMSRGPAQSNSFPATRSV